MKKAIITLIVIGAVAGCGYGAYRTGYLQKYAGKYLGKVIPALKTEEETEAEGRVSSTDPDAVYLDSVSALADLGSGDGVIERFAGVVEPQETKKYSVQSDRTVAKTYVKEGDEVKKGDKLFTYDIDTMKDKLEEAKIDLERLQNEVDVSEAKQEQLQKQLDSASTPEKKLQALEEQNTYKQQKLELKSKKNKIKSIQEQIDNSTVTSDIDGIVKTINQNAASGSSDSSDYSDLSSSDSSYITLLKVGTYRIKGTCNEQNIGSIREGEPMLVYSRVDPTAIWEGSISKIKTDSASSNSDDDSGSGSSDTNSSNYTFYVELESSDGLMLGQHVYLEQDVGQAGKKDGIWLGNYYFVKDDDGSTYVWAASDNNTLEKRKVELGDTDEDEQKTQVVSGLHADDYICAPADNLKEGLPVAYNGLADDGELNLDDYLYEETENSDFEDFGDASLGGYGSPMIGGTGNAEIDLSGLDLGETESTEEASVTEEDLVPIQTSEEDYSSDDASDSDLSGTADDSGEND